MPRGPAPGWRARKSPVLDEYVLASVAQSGGLGKHHPETGHYSELVIRGLKDREEAGEWSRALFRCAHYLNRTGQAAVSMSAKIQRDGTGYRIVFKAIDKMAAHVCETCGLLHDALVAEERESEAYRLAKLESETRIKLAQIERSAARQEVEAAVEVAEVRADAEVEAAAVEAEVIAAALAASDVEAEPIEIVAPDVVQDVDVEVDEDAPPETDGSPVPSAPSKATFGMW
jgi:hypothetical protein